MRGNASRTTDQMMDLQEGKEECNYLLGALIGLGFTLFLCRGESLTLENCENKLDKPTEKHMVM